MQYDIIDEFCDASNVRAGNIASRIESAMRKGWHLAGPLQITVIAANGYTSQIYYAQPMIMHDKDGAGAYDNA